MADIVKWTGISGWIYDFEVFPKNVEFNPVSGVYILCRQAGSILAPRLEALYVGETESLHNRLNAGATNHNGLKSSRQAGMTHIAVHRCEGATERLRIETDLRHALDPVFNRQNASLASILARGR